MITDVEALTFGSSGVFEVFLKNQSGQAFVVHCNLGKSLAWPNALNRGLPMSLENGTVDLEDVPFPVSLTLSGRLHTVGASCAGGFSTSPIASTTSTSTFASVIASSLSAPSVSVRSTITSSGEDEYCDIDYPVRVFWRDVNKAAPPGSAPEDGRDDAEVRQQQARSDDVTASDDGENMKHDDVESLKWRQRAYSNPQMAIEKQEEASENGERQSESCLCTTRELLGNKDLTLARPGSLGQPHEENVNTVTILSSALPHKNETESLEPESMPARRMPHCSSSLCSISTSRSSLGRARR